MTGTRQSGERLARAALLAVVLLALAVRALGFERVFVDDGRVVFAAADAWYHARRALFSYEHFPRVIWFDPCIGHPDGAVITYPPLYHWLLAALARASGSGIGHFERLAAWVPAALGALTVLPVFGIARAFAGRGVALGAAAIYALLPIAVVYSRVGNVDHHAAVALFGALLLFGFVRALDPACRGRALARAFAGLALARAALLLTWNGSLLYPGLGEIALLAAGSAGGRPELLRGQLASGLATLALVAPVLLRQPVPPGGPFSATELSWLHGVAYAGVAGVAAGALAWERRAPSASPAVRLARAAAVAVALGLALLALPQAREGLARAHDFMTQEDTWTSRVAENLPLFTAQGAWQRAAGEGRMGGFAYLLPFVPLAFAAAARRPGREARGRLLFAWTLVFGALAWDQVRYANEWAAAGCVGLALMLSGLRDALRRRGLPPRAATAAALAVGAALLAPAFTRFFVPFGAPTLAALTGRTPGGDRALLTVEGTQLRFAERVAALSPPETSCWEQEARPAAGVLSHPTLGHVLHYTARRATPADPFGPYGVREHYLDAMRFLSTEDEAEAVAIAERLRTPWVVTSEEGWSGAPASIAGRLQREDGGARDAQPHLGRFRLLSEGPRGGVPLSIVFESAVARGPFYKLWAVVPGALLEVRAAPGERVEARLPLQTPIGRQLVFRAGATAEPDGIARLRVPYPSEPGAAPAPGGVPGAERELSATVRALGPWRVLAGERRWLVHVPEAAVASGGVVRVDEPPDAAAQDAGRPAARAPRGGALHTAPGTASGRASS
jgi:dolichyl-diphosphooligosaccharide--protein glycosyltransferase